MTDNVLEPLAAVGPFAPHVRWRQRAEARRMRSGMRTDEMSPRVQFANLPGGEEPARADEVGGDEAMRPKSDGFKPVRDDCVVGDAAVVEGDHGPTGEIGLRG